MKCQSLFTSIAGTEGRAHNPVLLGRLGLSGSPNSFSELLRMTHSRGDLHVSISSTSRSSETSGTTSSLENVVTKRATMIDRLTLHRRIVYVVSKILRDKPHRRSQPLTPCTLLMLIPPTHNCSDLPREFAPSTRANSRFLTRRTTSATKGKSLESNESM